ncbi:MAG: hypothetical protein GW798_09830 [Roseovarius sp.]|nr:hypothetical protein [Roseovarius sp.]
MWQKHGEFVLHKGLQSREHQDCHQGRKRAVGIGDAYGPEIRIKGNNPYKVMNGLSTDIFAVGAFGDRHSWKLKSLTVEYAGRAAAGAAVDRGLCPARGVAPPQDRLKGCYWRKEQGAAWGAAPISWLSPSP